VLLLWRTIVRKVTTNFCFDRKDSYHYILHIFYYRDMYHGWCLSTSHINFFDV
jgi:hypothetical protein